MTPAVLVLRLAGPLQSWGTSSRHNRRRSGIEPSKSGLVGLLAAAQGRRRTDPVEDLVALKLGVRVDRPGQLRRDYHTVSRLDGRPLPQTGVTARGLQKPTAPAKYTHVTERHYLEEAVFVAALEGPAPFLDVLANAVREPAYPLALGRRACPPTQPLLLADPGGRTRWSGGVVDALSAVAWQVPQWARGGRGRRTPPVVHLPATVDDPNGDDVRDDVPISFAPQDRRFGTRRVRQVWISTPTGEPATDDKAVGEHDPFALLGW